MKAQHLRRYGPHLGLIGLMWIVVLAALPWAPERAALHWGLNGEPDRFGTPVQALVPLPVLGMLLLVLLVILPRFDPRRANYAAFAGAYRTIQITVLAALLAVELVIIAAMFNLPINISRVIGVLVAVLFVVLGNVLGKLRPNWFTGICTPWTLQSPDVWTRTHHVAGRTLVLVGVLLLVAALVRPPPAVVAVLLGGVLAWVVSMAVYSYLLWRRLGPEQKEGA